MRLLFVCRVACLIDPHLLIEINHWYLSKSLALFQRAQLIEFWAWVWKFAKSPDLRLIIGLEDFCVKIFRAINMDHLRSKTIVTILPLVLFSSPRGKIRNEISLRSTPYDHFLASCPLNGRIARRRVWGIAYCLKRGRSNRKRKNLVQIVDPQLIRSTP